MFALVENPHGDLEVELKSSVTKWEDFKTLIKSQFYPIWYEED